MFDALAHARVYKPAMPIEKCLAILREESGKHFDPKLVELMLGHLDLFLEIIEDLGDETQVESEEPELLEV